MFIAFVIALFGVPLAFILGCISFFIEKHTSSKMNEPAKLTRTQLISGARLRGVNHTKINV